MQKNDKQTVLQDEFLRVKPQRASYEWHEGDDNLIQIKVPKFTGNLGKTFCKIIKKENTFTANLDKLGPLVWQHCDGNHTIQQLIEILKKAFPQEDNIDQRLFLFLQQMHNLGYLFY